MLALIFARFAERRPLQAPFAGRGGNPMRPVFIHISKNAGTSIVSSAGDRIINAGHRTAASWVAEHGSEAPLFSAVRHPYDRVLSEYHYRRRRWEGGENNPHLTNLSLPFDEWVIATYEGDEYRTRSFFELTGVAYNAHNLVDDVAIWFISQVDWLSDSHQRLLVNDLLRFEHLADDWSTLSAKYDLKDDLVHVNSSPRPLAAEQQLTPGIRDLIYQYYRSDFDRFGYDH
jgi:hypothetical protein